ncbi:DNA topoisomerase family protein [Tatumella citrea]|uniref:DNA topoisomerase type IA zn finger domain-containing protein n=1 Tax=Tatumella citrea TaxID=53336 RepID=A0A1Y0LFP6_TATCI|nr:type I DNA topoisomerase [Tatumella citrea]ARU92454.1 hypothetical protein A7K98_00730 [Tatumella citrea]ARU96489.1 hypothetical protein A7K99_00730 [Tatumella citrea]
MNKTALFAVRHQENCPVCGAELVIRSGKHGPFAGCSAHPACEYIRPLGPRNDAHIIKILEGIACPECGADKALRQGRYGMFIGCSNYPECPHTETIDQPDETGIACPQCYQGTLVQRRSRYGKSFHSCSRYPDCQFALNTLPVAGECLTCHFPLLTEKKTARGTRLICANKLCGKPVPEDNQEE